MGISAKTQEILIVWVNEDMPTIAIDLSKIQKYISSMKEGIWIVKEEMFQPLREAISDVFERHMPVWLKPSEISVMKGMKYDVRQLFRKALNNKIKELKKTGERRRYLDRKQAIESITENDIEILNQIFGKSQSEEIIDEQVEKELKRMSI